MALLTYKTKADFPNICFVKMGYNAHHGDQGFVGKEKSPCWCKNTGLWPSDCISFGGFCRFNQRNGNKSCHCNRQRVTKCLKRPF